MLWKKDVHNAKIKYIEKRIPDITTSVSLNAKIKKWKVKYLGITSLATAPTRNAKINKVKAEIPNITNLATTTALTAVGNKMLNISNLFKKIWL